MGCFKKWGQVGSIKERGISRKNSINKGKKEKCKKYVGNFVPVVVKIESMQESPDEAYQNVDRSIHSCVFPSHTVLSLLLVCVTTEYRRDGMSIIRLCYKRQ